MNVDCIFRRVSMNDPRGTSTISAPTRCDVPAHAALDIIQIHASRSDIGDRTNRSWSHIPRSTVINPVNFRPYVWAKALHGTPLFGMLALAFDRATTLGTQGPLISFRGSL